MVHEIRTYVELRQQIHDDLRIQHPEWIEPNGESRMCDAYDARLTQLLDAIDANGIQCVNLCHLTARSKVRAVHPPSLDYGAASPNRLGD